MKCKGFKKIKGGIVKSFGIGFMVGTWLLASTAAYAEDFRTTYSINSSSATVTTKVLEASLEKENLLREFLFPTLAKKLGELPSVNSVTFNAGDKKSETVKGSSYSDYWERTRSYPAMIQLAMPASLTLMVNVEESYRVCKSVAEKEAKATDPSDDYYDRGGGSSSDDSVDCALSTTVKVTGPIAVYGNFASGVDINGLLKEKQKISFTLDREYSNKKNLELDGRFDIESNDFEISLFKFLQVFNLQTQDKEAFASRERMLVGMARVLRMMNEKVVTE